MRERLVHEGVGDLIVLEQVARHEERVGGTVAREVQRGAQRDEALRAEALGGGTELRETRAELPVGGMDEAKHWTHLIAETTADVMRLCWPWRRRAGRACLETYDFRGLAGFSPVVGFAGGVVGAPKGALPLLRQLALRAST